MGDLGNEGNSATCLFLSSWLAWACSHGSLTGSQKKEQKLARSFEAQAWISHNFY